MSDPGWLFPKPTLAEFKLLDAGADVTALGSFSGYLAVTGNLDDNGDIIQPGAFAKTLSDFRSAGELPPMLLNHAGIPFGGVTVESLLPIGVWTEMTEDSRGLAVKGRIDPMDTDLGKRIYAGMRNRTVKGLSIGFKATEFKRGTKAGDPARWISGLQLFEGSVVWSPGNPLANIDSVKGAYASMLEGLKNTRESLGSEIFDPRNVRHLEQYLREARLTKAEAKGILARGFKAGVSNPREVGDIPREAGAASAFDELLAELRSARGSVGG